MAGPGGIINLSDGDDHFPGAGDSNSGAETIFALNGSDTVQAGAENDTLYGGGGDDELFGEAGDDYIEGGDGNDRIEGGAGNDNIVDFVGAHANIDGGGGDDYVSIGGGFGPLSVINGGTGNDTLQSSTTNLDTMFISGFEGLDTFGLTMRATADQFEAFRFIRSSGEDPFALVSLQLFGTAGFAYSLNLRAELGLAPVFLVGSFGNDSLTTGRGNDQLWGDLGNDALNGGGGRDDLHGSAGRDTLAGGSGRDTLTGGSGPDVFLFEAVSDSGPAAGGDQIIGFGSGADRIDLSALGPLTFRATDPFDGAGQVRFEVVGGNTIIQVEVTGDTTADMTITLTGEHALVEDNFAL